MKVIIIGGIAAGMSAAAKLRRISKEAKITVYEKKSYVSFGACGLPYYIGNFFEEYERMLVRKPEQVIESGIELHTQHEVLHVDVKEKKIVVKNLVTQEELTDSYDKLMIATGASAVIPPMKGLEYDNVHVLRSLEDGFAVKEQLTSDEVQRVAIIGAGFIGLEVAEAVKHLGKEAIVFQLEDRVLKETFDTEITNLIEAELKESGVELHLNTKVMELRGDKKAHAVVTDQGEVSIDLVIVATGVRPNTAFLQSTGIQMIPNGALIIDEEGRTSIEDIYAAGDCATVPHMLKDTPAYIPLATTANKLGRIVGENLAGNHLKFEGTLGSGCVKVLGVEAGRTGLSEKEARDLGLDFKTVFITDKNHTDYFPGQEKLSVKLIYDANSKVILGGQTVGKSDAVLRTNVLVTAITAKMTTTQLGMLDLCYAPPFARTWDVLNVAGNVAK